MPVSSLEERARRVLLHGVTCSGKSTAAMVVGGRLDLRVHLADDGFGWLPGWVPRPADEMRALVAVAAAEPAWVFDTAYGTFRDLVEPREVSASGWTTPAGSVWAGYCAAPWPGPLTDDRSATARWRRCANRSRRTRSSSGIPQLGAEALDHEGRGCESRRPPGPAGAAPRQLHTLLRGLGGGAPTT